MKTGLPQLCVVVPVLARPQNVVPLVESFLTSGTPGRLMFVVEVDDVDEHMAVSRACAHQRVGRVDVVSAHTWPEKICAGYKACKGADWFLMAADDVTFMPGWWEATAELRADPDVGVIGTNDLANPRCIAGEHTTHPLMRGTYIERWGTVTAPDTPVHPGYKHWFVDDELVWTAKMRGAWAACPEAVIAHHHPYFDLNVEWDGTYAEGEQGAGVDRKLFCKRAPMFGVECG